MKTILFLATTAMAFSSLAVQAGDAGKGEKLYGTHCVACHQATGAGIPGAFPPLAGSDYLADKTAAITVPVKGLSGKVTVNGTEYNSAMPPLGHLPDEDIADIMTYVMNAWGNSGGDVTAAEVAAVR